MINLKKKSELHIHYERVVELLWLEFTFFLDFGGWRELTCDDKIILNNYYGKLFYLTYAGIRV